MDQQPVTPMPPQPPASALKKHYRGFWFVVAIATVSAIVGGILVWMTYNLSLTDELNSLIPMRHVEKKSNMMNATTTLMNYSPEIYTNQKYGFGLTLNGAWNGYKVFENPSQFNDGVYLVFAVPLPEGDRWAGNHPGYFDLLGITVQSSQAWNQRVKDCGCGNDMTFQGAYAIGKNGSMVFSLENVVQDVPDNFDLDHYQMDEVVKSFKILE